MNSTLQIRIDRKTKEEARKAFSDMGLDISSGIKVYLAKVAASRKIPFELTADHLPEKVKQQMVRETTRARKSGTRFASARTLHRTLSK